MTSTTMHVSAPEGATAKPASGARKLGRVTAFANLKGGVGKTTSAVNLACALARGVIDPETGRTVLPPQKTLFIDFESLCTGSAWLGVTAKGPQESCAVLFEDQDGSAERILALCKRATNENVDVIPADSRGVEVTDGSKGDSDYTLADNIALLREHYDQIIIDLPGQRQNRMFRAALIAADGIVIPVLPDSAVMKSMKPLLVAIGDVQRGANNRLQLDGWLICRAGYRNDPDAAMMQEMLKQNAQFYTFDSMIRTLKAISRAPMFNTSVFGVENNEEAARDYSRFASEWVRRING